MILSAARVAPEFEDGCSRTLRATSGRSGRQSAERAGLPLRLSRSFVAEPQAVPGARRAVEELDGTLGQEARRRLSAVACELVGNSVRHASRRPTDPISLEVFGAAERLRLQVTDRGKGFEPLVRRGRASCASTAGACSWSGISPTAGGPSAASWADSSGASCASLALSYS
jgi:anti-sigma regulatory factor (Ser/Thr protein kinase)